MGQSVINYFCGILADKGLKGDRQLKIVQTWAAVFNRRHLMRKNTQEGWGREELDTCRCWSHTGDGKVGFHQSQDQDRGPLIFVLKDALQSGVTRPRELSEFVLRVKRMNGLQGSLMSVPHCHMGICILEGENGFPGLLESGLLTRGPPRVPAVRWSLLTATLTHKHVARMTCAFGTAQRGVFWWRVEVST